MSVWISELRSDVPTILVSEGTVHSREPLLLRAAAEGLGGLPVQVIMTTGTHRRPEDLGLHSLAPNIRVESFVSYSDLLPHTNLVVTTGGAGTVLAALSAGIPMLVVPTEWDKPENARRVLDSGAGLWLSPRHCTAKRVRSAVARLLSDQSFARNARRLASIFSRSGGPEQAAELLQDLAQSRIGAPAHSVQSVNDGG